MGNLIKSKKYTGVYYRKKNNGDVTYYFTYKEPHSKKPIYQKVGLKSQGVTEQYVSEKRDTTILEIRNGEVPKLLKNKSKYKITFGEMADYYFENRIVRSNVKRRKLYELRLKPVFGDKNIHTIKSIDILKFRNQFVGQMKPHTINLYVELMITIINYYIKHMGLKIENPALKVDKLEVNNIRNRILTKSEVELLFVELQNDFMLSLFCSLCLCTGARKSTVLNYKVKDINLEHRTLNSYDFKNQSQYVSFIDNRTYELLQIRLNSPIYTATKDSPLVYVDGVTDLSRWVNRQLKGVFDTLFNQGLNSNDIQNRVVIHSLRHTVLSHLGMKGISEHIIKKISNHKSTQIVGRYVKLDENTGKNEIEKLWD